MYCIRKLSRDRYPTTPIILRGGPHLVEHRYWAEGNGDCPHGDALFTSLVGIRRYLVGISRDPILFR